MAVASLPAAVVFAVALIVRWHDGYVPISSGCCSDHSYYLAMAGGLPGIQRQRASLLLTPGKSPPNDAGCRMAEMDAVAMAEMLDQDRAG